MSNYTFKATCKDTGDDFAVTCLDNYFGPRKYGYMVHERDGDVMNEADFRAKYYTSINPVKALTGLAATMMELGVNPNVTLEFNSQKEYDLFKAALSKHLGLIHSECHEGYEGKRITVLHLSDTQFTIETK
jgi:hypothetical protein